MSETMALSVFGAIAALFVTCKYLHRQNTDLYAKIMENKDEHAKCMESHARTEERSIYLDKELSEMKLELRAVQDTQRQVMQALPNPVPSSAKDTEVAK